MAVIKYAEEEKVAKAFQKVRTDMRLTRFLIALLAAAVWIMALYIWR
jgi:hypothetical protein